MNDRRRLFSSAAFVAVTALVLFFPHLISSPIILPLLNKQLNRTLPGKLELQSCSFRWSGGLACRDVRYTDQQRGLRLQLPQVSTDKGLFTLLVAPGYLGEITLDQPSLVFLESDAPQKPPLTDPPQAQQMPGEQLPVSWWEDRKLRFQLLGGQILADRGSAGPPRILAREVSLSGDLALGTINYSVDLQNAQATGRLHAQGFVNLPIAGQPFFSSLVSQSTLDIRSMEIEPLLELAAGRLPDVPLGHGILNGACRLDMAGIGDLVIKGEATLDDLELRGGILGQDQPRLRQAQLTFEGSRHPAEGWRLSQLELRSDPLSFSARGLLDRQQVDFNGQGKADLPLLTGALPHFFAIHDQTRIHKGSLAFIFQAKGPLDGAQFQADCDTQRLEVVQAGHPYAWDNPLSLHAAAIFGPAGAHFSRLEFNAPFLTVEGQGGLEQFSLKATADLDQFFSELEKVFTLNLHARGQLALALDSNRLQQDLVRLTALLRIENFGVEQRGETLLPVHPFSIQGELTGRPWFLPKSGLRSLRLAVEGWPGSLALWGDRLQDGPEEQNEAAGENCRINISLSLQRLEQMVGILRGQRSSLGIQGQLQAEARGVWRQAVVRLHQLKGQVQPFVFAPSEKSAIREPQVDLSLESGVLHLEKLHMSDLQIVQGTADATEATDFCRIDLQPLALDLHHLRLQSTQAIVDVQAFLGRRPDRSTGPVWSVRGLGDLQLLASWWHHLGWLDAKVEASGRTLSTLIVRPATFERPRSTEFTLQVKGLSLREGRTHLHDDPKVRLELELQAGEKGNQEKGGQVTKITRVKLEASPLSFVGAGTALDRGNLPRLDLQGELHPRAALMDQVLPSLLPGKIFLQGIQPGKVFFSGPLHFPVDLGQVTLSGQLETKELRYLGIPLSQAKVPIDLNRSILEMRIRGEGDGGGQVSIQPKWRQEGKALLLHLEPGSQVLKHLPITEPVTQELLEELPPLGCLVQATGMMGLKIIRFSLPMGGRRQPDFGVVIDLERARPKAVSALKQVLDTAGLAHLPLRFQERELICEGWNGSITCAPLRLKVGGQDLHISGSTRRNGQIAYRVELPVTRALASRANVSVQGNFSAVAEITGTRKDPVFDQTTLFQGLAAQITANLPKPVLQTDPPSAPSGNDVAPAAATVQE